MVKELHGFPVYFHQNVLFCGDRQAYLQMIIRMYAEGQMVSCCTVGFAHVRTLSSFADMIEYLPSREKFL